MGEYAVLAAFAYLDALDVTPIENQWSMDGSAETRDKTTFRNSGARRFRSTLLNTNLTIGGFTDFDDGGDAALWAGFQGRGVRVVTVGNEEAEGMPCCMMQAVNSQLTPWGGPVGDLSSFAFTAQGTDRWGGVRGILLKEQGSVSATGAIGTAVQLGAVGASQRVFSTLHLLGTAGTSITVVLESDADDTFASATTRITFGPLTTAGGTWATPVPGAIADTWWRFRVTAVTGTWTVGGAAGIE